MKSLRRETSQPAGTRSERIMQDEHTGTEERDQGRIRTLKRRAIVFHAAASECVSETEFRATHQGRLRMQVRECSDAVARPFVRKIGGNPVWAHCRILPLGSETKKGRTMKTGQATRDVCGRRGRRARVVCERGVSTSVSKTSTRIREAIDASGAWELGRCSKRQISSNLSGIRTRPILVDSPGDEIYTRNYNQAIHTGTSYSLSHKRTKQGEGRKNMR